jgi:hypothetical protein
MKQLIQCTNYNCYILKTNEENNSKMQILKTSCMVLTPRLPMGQALHSFILNTVLQPVNPRALSTKGPQKNNTNLSSLLSTAVPQPLLMGMDVS